MRFYNDPKFVWVAVGDGNFRVVRSPSRNLEMKDDMYGLACAVFWKSDFLRAVFKLGSNIANDRPVKLVSTFSTRASASSAIDVVAVPVMLA